MEGGQNDCRPVQDGNGLRGRRETIAIDIERQLGYMNSIRPFDSLKLGQVGPSQYC